MGLTVSLVSAARSVFAETAAPPSQVFAADLAAAGARNLVESGQDIDRQSDAMGSFSWIGRRPLQGGPFYISGGLRGESFNVQNAQAFPVSQLQDYGAQLSVEYYVGALQAAYLTIRPGFYFETRPTTADWDVPVEFATGIPMTGTLNGVAGITWGRFWHHPVPIAGLSWTMNSQWRLDAVFPDPALVYTINERLEARLSGELLGNGFRTNDDSVVEYHVYRAGGNLAWRAWPGFKVTGGAGLEYEREFDFWRAGQSFRATGAPYLRLGVELSTSAMEPSGRRSSAGP